MRNLINKLIVPFFILLFINAIGLLFYKNYDGAVAGSIIGVLCGFLVLEIRAKFD
jgi:hypothetical protein